MFGVRKMHVPEPLYKYTTYDTAAVILSSGQLRWASPLLFNDLAEFQRMPRFKPTLDQSLTDFHRVIVEIALGERDVEEAKLSGESSIILVMVRALIDSGMGRDDIIKELMQKSRGADKKMTMTLRATFESFGLSTARVFCLSTEFDNDVMWAHYAENHEGLVFGFRHLPNLDTPFLAAQSVKYSSEPPVIGSGLDVLLYGNTPELEKKTLNAVCFTKSSKWKYENEWRVVTWRPEEVGKDYGDYKFYPEELESVCFGARFDDKREEKIRSLVLSRYPRTNLYRMVVESGELRRVIAS